MKNYCSKSIPLVNNVAELKTMRRRTNLDSKNLRRIYNVILKERKKYIYLLYTFRAVGEKMLSFKGNN